MKVKTLICPFFERKSVYDKDFTVVPSLEETINTIGYENILEIIPIYLGEGEYAYTIIYKGGTQDANY